MARVLAFAVRTSQNSKEGKIDWIKGYTEGILIEIQLYVFLRLI